MHPPRPHTWIALAVLAAACGAEGGAAGGDEAARSGAGEASEAGAGAPSVAERLERWESERPGEPVRASVAFGELRSDSAVAAVLERHSVRPYRAFVRVAGLATSHRVPPSSASLRFLDELENQVRTGLEMSLCAQPRKAASMLDRGGVDPSEARAVLEQVERSRAAVARMGEARTRYIWAVEVVGVPEQIRGLASDPAVARLEPADPASEPAVVPQPSPPPRAAGSDATASDSASGALRGLPADSLVGRLSALAEDGIEGCEPAPPPAARR